MSQVQQYSLVFVGGEGAPLSASTLPLVAALIALDCHPVPESPLVETIEDISPPDAPESVFEHKHRWIFSEASGCKRYKTDTLRRWWISAKWLTENLGHPLAQIRLNFHLTKVLQFNAAGEWIDCEPENFAALFAAADRLPALHADWNSPAYRAANRQRDPVTCAVADAFAVLELLKAEVLKSVPLMIVKKGQRRAFVPIDATPEEEERLLSRLEKTNQ